MKEKYAHGELSKEILLAFLEGGLLLSCIVMPGMAHVLKLFQPDNARERYRLKRAFEDLRKKGYVKRRIKNGREEFVVAAKGKRKIAEYLAGDLKIGRPKKWDKKWRIVMFDIPNTQSRKRQEVSFKIKDMGMYAIQDSVFVSPFPCKAEIDFLITQLSLEKYFVYFEADSVESTENLLAHFNLKK